MDGGDTNLAVAVSDAFVELFTLQNDEVVAGRYYTALSGYGSCCIDVVTSNHSHSDSSILTFYDSLRHLHGKTGQTTDTYTRDLGEKS